MLPASMIALARNLPLADIDGFAQGRLLATGHTRRDGDDGDLSGFRHALVIDDTCRTGASIREARAKLAHLDCRITYAAVYGAQERPADVDLVCATVPEPRVFEWNVLHHPIVSRSCFDIDGVLCVDPTEPQNDDGAAYLDFLMTAVPLHRPRREIAMLVTSRLEKYRRPTEEWLRRHGVRYRELRMLDLPDAATRRRLGTHGSFKAEVYRESSNALFVESELPQARDIARLSGKPVLSLQGPQMIVPGLLNPQAVRQKITPAKLRARLGRVASRMLRAKRLADT
ncbi:phosphoribosyltransferase [Novosphingobium sp. BL-52-GroH]|uniref:phosphoribosyltransferase n=1 Tax=Novosphingobium sp. BL-52-GroH TaxID=3349877 RepID=UPI00384CACC7